MAKRGRPFGSGNKPLKRLLQERLAERYPDYDPVLEMVDSSIKIKQQADQSNDIADHKSAIESLDRVSKYLEPTLKAVEVKSDSALTVSVQRKRFDGVQPTIDGFDE